MVLESLSTFQRHLILQITIYYLQNFEYYAIRGIPNEWFTSYLGNRKQVVSLNGSRSNLANVKCVLPQGFILGHLRTLGFSRKGKIDLYLFVCVRPSETSVAQKCTKFVFWHEDKHQSFLQVNAFVFGGRDQACPKYLK